MVLLFSIVFAFLICVIIAGMYNKLVVLKNRVKNAHSQINVQLKRRHDLIPNLVETTKGYMAHEKTVLENVVKARNLALEAKDNAKAQAQFENQLSGALKTLFAVAENYPDLKANQNFLALQEELVSTENKIGFARQFYNDSVMQYNTQKEVFPYNIFVGMFNFEKFELFELENPNEAEVVKVKFD